MDDLDHERKASWELLDEAEAQRLKLLANGYVPLPTTGKIPAISAWQNGRPGEAEIKQWTQFVKSATNTGITCAYVPVVDIDVMDAAVADEITSMIERMIGADEPVLIKFGRKPKRSILFKTALPFEKVQTGAWTDKDGAAHHVEILGDGQQTVAYGVHPDTGTEYEWPVDNPLDVPRARLPELTREQAQGIVNNCIEIFTRHGWQGEAPAPAPKPPRPASARSRAGLREHRYADAALDGAAAEIASTPEGNRNHVLNAKAYKAGAMIEAGWVGEERAEVVLLNAARAAGLDEHEAKRTLKSGLDAGKKNPRPPLETSTTAAAYADSTEQDDADLAELNAKYAVVRVGGKTRVMWLEDSVDLPGRKEPEFATFEDFKKFTQNRKKLIRDGDETRVVAIGKWWTEHPERRQYDRVVYAPEGAPRNVFNLWTGFSCEPRNGPCPLYLDHLLRVICCGDRGHYAYLLNWMAYAVQHPGRQGEVAVVLRGKEGCGKGICAGEIGFGGLFGAHFRPVTHSRHLVGNFNKHLMQCSVVYANEAFFAGDRAHESVLKAMITERTILVEPKGIDPFEVKNNIHLIMSSNENWVIPAGADARRYFVLNVSDKHMRDFEYFEKIINEMENGGREALLHMLQHRDLSQFNVRNVPQTAALAEQKGYSRRGIDSLVEYLAHEGSLPAHHRLYPHIAITTGYDDGKGFHAIVRRIVDLRHTGPTALVRELCAEWGCKPYRRGGLNGIEFLPLMELRAMFDAKHGPQEWPDGDDWQLVGTVYDQ